MSATITAEDDALVIDLLEWQAEMVQDDTSRGLVCVGGLRSGKSFGFAHKVVKRALQWPSSQTAIVAKTVKQLRGGTLVTFKAVLHQWGFQEGVHFKQNKTTLAITMIAGPIKGYVFHVFSVENGAYESLKSGEYDTIWADELQTWDDGERAFAFMFGRNRASPPALAAYGYVEDGEQKCRLRSQVFASANPPDNPAHWLAIKFLNATAPYQLAEDPNATIRLWRVTTFDNYLAADRFDFIRTQRAVLSKERFRVEILGEVGIVGEGRAYTAFLQLRHVASPAIAENAHGLPSLGRDGLPVIDRTRPVIITHDFGVTPRAATVMQQHKMLNPPFGFKSDLIYVIDEIEISPGSTQELIEELVRRTQDPTSPLFGIEQLRIEWEGDPAGQNRNSTTGESDWTMLREHQALQSWDTHDLHETSSPLIKDRVNTVNWLLSDDYGNVGMLLHPRCAGTILDFSSTKWKTGTGKLDHGSVAKGILRTHLTDTIGYPVERRFRMTRMASGALMLNLMKTGRRRPPPQHKRVGGAPDVLDVPIAEVTPKPDAAQPVKRDAPPYEAPKVVNTNMQRPTVGFRLKL